MSDVATLLRDPHWFPVAFDLNANTLTLWKTDRDALSQAAFLDQRAYSRDSVFQTVPLAAALEAGSPTASINWIFHSAFCCSTLLARALDIPNKSLALKEPDILMQLANARRMAASTGLKEPVLQKLEQFILNLLGRRFNANEAIVIKPTNAANPVMQLAVARGEACMFAVSPLQDFLISVIKKGEACRSFMRTLYNIFVLDPLGLAQIPARQAMTFTDLQVTALVWHHQLQFMTGTADKASKGPVKALDGTQLPANPAPYLMAAAAHFGLDWEPGDAQAQATGPVFQRNSKFEDQTYDVNVRREEAAVLLTAHREAIDVTLKWAGTLNLGGRIAMLPAPALV